MQGEEDDGWFSVVVANRFPDSTGADGSGAVNYAHLVSLEGLTRYLVDDPPWPLDAAEVQLVSLASWRFVSVARAGGQTFSQLVTHLVEPSVNDPGAVLLRIPVTDDGSDAAARLLDGYTALSFHTQPGVDTFAWYRGPFSAAPAQPLPESISQYVRPAQAMIYDQRYAVFDNSYGAAWNIGRLTALADPVFAESIQRLRKGIVTTLFRLLERSKMAHLSGVTDLRELASPGLTRKTFLDKVWRGLGDDLTRSFDRALPGARRAQSGKNFLFPYDDVPDAPADEVRWFLGKPEIRSFLGGEAGGALGPLADWLARLVLLYNVPFNYLVPDQRMLPVESLRFFYVDQGWLKALFDGAVSVGINEDRELQIQLLFAGELWEQTRRKAPGVRRKLLRRPGEQPPQMPAAGILIRSALVSGWPGLSIRASADGQPVALMRMDLLAPDVLLALWSAVPDTVLVGQPEQGLVFGVDDDWQIPLRSLEEPNVGAQLGTNFPPPGDGDIKQFMRAPDGGLPARVLKLMPPQEGMQGYLIPALSAALGQTTDLSPAQFAIEMNMAPERIRFDPPQ